MKINTIDPEKIENDDLIVNAKLLHELGQKYNIPNVFQPGLIKELIIAKKLKHNLITNKNQPDAVSKDGNYFYEYLSSYDGGNCQIDRFFKSPYDKRQKSFERIIRNHLFYMAYFVRESLIINNLYEVETKIVSIEIERQLDVSTNDISHVGFSEEWCKINGRLVYSLNDSPKNPNYLQS